MSATHPSANTGNRLSGDELRFVARLSGVSIARMFGLFMVLPVLAFWAASFTDATPLLVGIAVGGYGVTQALLQAPYGALSDRVGRAPVLIAGLGLFVAGSVLAALADSITAVIAGRLLQGAGAVSATLSAWLADRTREQVRTPAMALFGATIGASFLLALIVGPVLSLWLGVRGLFWASAVLGLVAIALVVPAYGFSRPAAAPRTSRGWLHRDLWRAELMQLNVAVLILHAGLAAFFVLSPFVLTDALGLAAGRHWQVYTLTLLGALPLAVPMILADHGAAGRWLPAAAQAMIAAGLLLAWFGSDRLVWFAAGCCLFFAGFSYLEAALPARMSRRAPAGRRGASLGLFSSSQFFGIFLGSTAAGALLGTTGALAGLLGLALVFAGWLVLDTAYSLKSAR